MLEKVFGKWVAHKAFDMIEAEEQFEKYKKDLKLGELVIIEDETIKKVYVQDGKYVSSMHYRDREINGVEMRSIGTPCLHFIFMNGAEEYILCYDLYLVNSKTGDKKYDGRVRPRVLSPDDIDYLKSK